MAKELSFVVSDPVGLHARPATILVNQASKFTSNIKAIATAVRTATAFLVFLMCHPPF